MDPAVLRILDVNLNRTREALRTIEDYARFVCDDAAAAASVKTCRHVVQEIVATLGVEALLAARDIGGDVGRDLKTEGELNRATSEDVARAAFGRLTEATRSLAEFSKLLDAAVASKLEALRYRAYELEQCVILRTEGRSRFRKVRLYVLLTEAYCRKSWVEVAEAVLKGRAGCIQLREKTLPDGELLRRARRLRELTARYDALLAVNDRPDIARLSQADIVHVGQDDLSVNDARRIAGPRVLVGKSTHTPSQFEAALAETPDYVAIGPMFASQTKEQPYLAGPEMVRAMRPRTEVPLVAIGGITASNAAVVRAGGADVVAVCQAVVGATDPEAAAAEVLLAGGGVGG